MTKLVRMMWIGFLICGLVIFFLSCATTSPAAYNDLDTAVYSGDFEAGIEAIREGQDAKKPLYPESNAISLYLDKGMLEHYSGNYAQSSQDLQEAERLIQEAYTKSVSADVASYIANDNAKDYAGEDFEDIYINVFNALNYYKQGNTEGAMVEIRKLILQSGKLDIISRKYEENSGKKAGDWVLEQLSKFGFRLSDSLPQGEPMSYSGSALAQYLGALFFLADGNRDSARIAFNAVGEAYAANPNIYQQSIPKAVEEAGNVPAGKARLNVIAFAGLSPVKQEGTFNQYWPFMQNPELQNIVFKLPVFTDRDSGDHRVSVTVNGETFELELMEDMGTVAKETYKAKFANLFFKTYLRVLLKYAAADIAATQALERIPNAIAANVARLAAANVGKLAIEASEGADIRMGRYLPNKAYVGGINLDPGSYPVTITFSSGFRTEIVVDVKAGDINLVDAVSLTANSGSGGTVAAAGATSSRSSASSSASGGQPAADGETTVQRQQPAAGGGGTASRQPAASSRQTSDAADAWKNKWVYLGGAFGAGAWYQTIYDYEYYFDNDYVYTYLNTGPFFTGSVVADFALLSFFSVEVDIGIGYGEEIQFILPMLAKFGGRFGQIELSANAGYTLGLGWTFGGTFGVHAGPGVIFTEFMAIPWATPPEGINIDSVYLGLIGYKIGLGSK